MRCLTLADALADKGADCTFVCRKANGNLLELIENRGFKSHALPADVTAEQDWMQTNAFIETLKHKPLWLVVDHYNLDIEWERHIRPVVYNTMVIDDMANRKHMCELLLDQNLVPDMSHRYKDLIEGRCVELFGPKYALLRDEFAEERKQVTKRKFPPESILVNFGGGDHKSMCLMTMRALKMAGYKGKVTLVAGGLNPDMDELEALATARPNTEFHKTTNKMATLMREADLAIGASGSTTWERMCLGLPCVTIAIAENQVEIASFLGKHHYAFYAGLANDIITESFAEYLEEVLADEEKFRGIEQYSMDHVDGKGAHFVADIMLDKDNGVLK